MAVLSVEPRSDGLGTASSAFEINGLSHSLVHEFCLPSADDE